MRLLTISWISLGEDAIFIFQFIFFNISVFMFFPVNLARFVSYGKVTSVLHLIHVDAVPSALSGSFFPDQLRLSSMFILSIDLLNLGSCLRREPNRPAIRIGFF